MSFGRKGLEGDRVALDYAPMPVASAPSEAVTPPMSRARAATAPRDYAKIALYVFFALIGLLSLEAFLSGTTLITPLPDGVVFWMTAIGAIMGFVTGTYLWFYGKLDTRGVRTMLGMFLGMPLLIGAWFHVITWRLADNWEFAFSDAQWETAEYRVEDFDFGRKGRRDNLSINPFDAGDAEIPIPDAQYDAFWTSAGEVCVTVEQRTSPSGAIQIKTDGVFTLSEPAPVVLEPC